MSHPVERTIPAVSDGALELMLDGAIEAFALKIEADWRAEALVNLRMIADAANLVRGLDLGDEFDPAPVYRP
ncbi:AtzG-like protein [Roseixanthobacter glucoisosaccharinicivorans]|uniref:AtzG-like protein n=1 Tax=Roseixanthobacter glucoisosaccharinicivorans TaxID=3119923 RepID=UPI003729B24F